MDTGTLIGAINRAFDSVDRRARVIERLIAEHRDEFGESTREPSIDAVCISMATLAALAKYRFESITDRGPEQFRELLNAHARTSFADRVSVPELSQSNAAGISPEFTQAVGRRFLQALPGSMYPPHDDPNVEEFADWMLGAGFTAPNGLWRFFHSSLIYAKYRNPVFHSLRIADGEEPFNMWFGEPEVYYANVLRRQGREYEQQRLFGVTDRYLLRLVREVSADLRAWCVRESRWLFD